MLEKLNHILNVIIGTAIGVFTGHSLYICWDYKVNPMLYAMQSAPWYISIQVYGVITLFVLIVAVILKFVIKKFMKRNVK